jgi:metallophosphoesterase (TIGR00282 family)
MKFLFFGDIMGRSGREALAQHLPALRAHYAPDFVVANAENAAAGYGLTKKLAEELLGLGIDALTTGNHVWDQKELLTLIDGMPNILRPCNFPQGTPGNGKVLLKNAKGLRMLVINVMGRLFMDAMDDPFMACEHALEGMTLGKNVDAIFIDAHAEASSEKQALAHHFDGRVTAVIGSHTHVPTADTLILPGGTARQTDAGMCGDYDSVIGMKKETATAKQIRKFSFERLSPAEGEGTVCGAFIETTAQGLAQTITPICVGGVLGKRA